MKFRLSIKSNLAILVAACLLPASTVALGLLAYSYEQNKQQLLENSLTTARTVSHLLDQHFSNVESTLNALATSPSLSTGDLAAFHWQAKESLFTQKIANVVLTGPDGVQLLNTLRPFGAALAENGSRIRIRHFGDSQQAVISDLFQGKVAARPVIAVAVPVRRSGQVLYGLSAGMSPAVFDAMLRQQEFPRAWIVSVVDRNGIVVARTGGMASQVGKPVTAQLRAALGSRGEGQLEGRTPDGIDTYASFKRSEMSGWSVVIGIPTEQVASQLRHTLSGLFFAFLALFSAGVLGARMLGKRIATAITALIAPATALGEGRTVTVPPLPLAEADEVGKALVRASGMLEQARYQATHDTLTGLANRALFHEIIVQQVALSNRNGSELSILYIDLDRFKPINDRYGHAAGDRVLVHVARQLRASLRDADFAARLGGDEFAVVLAATGAGAAAVVAAKILEQLSVPVALDGGEVEVGASIGIACHPRDGRNIRELLHAADEAMYRAKAAGQQRVVLAGAATESAGT